VGGDSGAGAAEEVGITTEGHGDCLEKQLGKEE
jgi:hypothetical protein